MRISLTSNTNAPYVPKNETAFVTGGDTKPASKEDMVSKIYT